MAASTQLNKVRDRVSGLLWGLAAGDRNGGPIRMALRLAESLLQYNTYNRKDVIDRYYKWFKGPPHDEEKSFDTGSTFLTVFTHVDKGMDIDAAADLVLNKFQSAGVNAAHRAPVLACVKSISEADLAEITKQESTITHKHKISVAVAVIVTVLCRHLIQGDTLAHALEKVKVFQDKRDFQTKTMLTKCPRNSLSTDGSSPNVLKAALYFLGNGSDFSSTLNESINFAGAANYCPVIVGSIGGALYGFSAIADNDLKHIDKSLLVRLQKVSTALSEMWS